MTGLTTNTTYHYRITARAHPQSKYWNSPPSAILTVTTEDTSKRLAPVSNFRSVAVTSTYVTFAWDAPASTTGLADFRIEACDEPTCEFQTFIGSPARSDTSYTVSHYPPGETYYYRIIARANAGHWDSEPSAFVEVEVPED